jgi:hypothetical protein
MKFCSALLTIFSVCVLADAFVPRSRPALMRGGGNGLPMSATAEEPKTEGKKAGEDAPPTHLGWNSHMAVVRR